MGNIIEKGIALGLGVVTMTKEKGEEIVDRLVEKGEISKEEAPEFLEDIRKRAKEEKEEIEKRIQKSVESALEKYNIPSQRRVKRIEDKLDELIDEIGALKEDKE